MNADALFKPKPWLTLFRTDFHSLLASPLPPSIPPPPSSSPSSSSSLFARAALTAENQKKKKTCSAEEDEDEEQKRAVGILSLPPDLLFAILSRLEPEQLSTLAQVSRHFLPHAYEPAHWRRAALSLWPHESPRSLELRLHEYKTWRLLTILRPRLRTNGIYVLRHQFAKTANRDGLADEREAPVFLVTYFRFLRFYADGTVVSLTTAEPPATAFRRVRRAVAVAPDRPPPPTVDRKTPPVAGRFDFDETARTVTLALPMIRARPPSSASVLAPAITATTATRIGTLYLHLSLGSSVAGAFDRLFVVRHYAIMEHGGGELVHYPASLFTGRAFRHIPIWGFRARVERAFPRDDERDLHQWAEMRKAARAAGARVGAPPE